MIELTIALILFLFPLAYSPGLGTYFLPQMEHDLAFALPFQQLRDTTFQHG